MEANGRQVETTLAIIEQLERKISLLKKKPFSKKVTTGFDGFIDSIRKPVLQRTESTVTYYKTLVDFAERVKNLSGKSGQVELEVQKIKMGGNAPILSNAIGMLGVKTTCMGSMGFPVAHKVFENISSNCEIISLSEAGESDAIEFDDGKLIVSELSMFRNYDWEYIKKTAGLESLRKKLLESDLLAFVDWANLQHAENIWEGVLHDIIKPSGRKDFLFFFDLCDPGKKSPVQIDEILDAISSFSFYGKVTLGLNTNEAMTIWSSLTGTPHAGTVEEAGKFIHYAMNIDTLLIHPIDRTIVFQGKDTIELPGRFVTNPKIQTGGGDNLNAGYIFGLLAGFPIRECMIMGMAASGSYVQEGKSATLDDIQRYLTIWRADLKPQTESVQKLMIA